MGRHYLVLTLPDGKDAVRREHLELLHPDETLDEAIERWVTRELGSRQRRRAEVSTKLRVSILGARIARPTSHYRDEINARESGETKNRGGRKPLRRRSR